MEQCRVPLENKGFRLSRSTAKCVKCQFNEGGGGSVDKVTIGGATIPRIDKFKYRGLSFKKVRILMMKITNELR